MFPYLYAFSTVVLLAFKNARQAKLFLSTISTSLLQQYDIGILMATSLLLYKCYSGAYYLATNRLLIVVIHISQNQRRSER